MDPKQLEGREAECDRCHVRRPSDPKLGFFEFKGEGSRHATESCKHCMYLKCAHERQPALVVPTSCVERGECSGFEPRGPAPTDSFWCGCGSTD
jgi:hypothetical protein